MVDFDKVLFRCSSLGALMTDSRDKKELIGETAKKELMRVYVGEKYGRFDEIDSKYLEKGNTVEEESITTISRVTKLLFKKNTERVSNDFVTGLPDLYKGESITKADIVRDAKSSWSMNTFMNAKNDKNVNKNYFWQLTGYMWLTGAKYSYIDYCLNNTPYQLVENELRKESYKYIDNDTPAWVELQIIANHVYDKETFDLYINSRGINPVIDENAAAIYHGFVEVPINERHYAVKIAFDEANVEALVKRIGDCRQWMKDNLNP